MASCGLTLSGLRPCLLDVLSSRCWQKRGMFRRDELEMLRESDRENAHRDWGKARRFAKALNLQHKMVELVGHAHDAPADALAATEGTPAAAPSPTPSPLISPVATCEGL